MESDCLKVVQALHSSVTLASPFGLIISDCKQLLRDIAEADFCFVKRSANKISHCMARQAYILSDRRFTEDNAPSEVLSLCMIDKINE